MLNHDLVLSAAERWTWRRLVAEYTIWPGPDVTVLVEKEAAP